MELKSLEQTTLVQILMYLEEHKEAKMTELMKELKSSQHPIYTALRILKELKLIEEEITSYPLRRLFTLTDRGVRVAGKLAEVEAILTEKESI